MARSVFHLMEFACSQRDPCLGKEQASSTVYGQRMICECLLQRIKRSLFVPDCLV